MIKSSDDELTVLRSNQVQLPSLYFLVVQILSIFFSIFWKPQYSWSALLFSIELCWFPKIKNWKFWSDNVMTRLPELYGEFQLLLNILSMGVADVAVPRVWLAICGKYECYKSRKFEMLLFMKCYYLYGILVDRY